MATAIPIDPDDLLFENTNVNKIMTFSPPSEKPFGILDLQPNSITEPPEFTEQETLEAMRNLHVLPSDLVPTNIEAISGFDDNPSMKIQVTLELERRRFKTIENIIQERNRLVNIVPEAIQIPKDLPPEILSKLQPSKKKKPKKKLPVRHSLKADETDNHEQPSSIPVRPRKKKSSKSKRLKKPSSKKPESTSPPAEDIKSPLRTDLIQKSKISRPKLSNRRHHISDFQSLTMVHKDQDINAFRKQRQEEQQEKAARVHARMAAAEKRQQDIKEKQQEIIRKRAQLRLQRLKGEETALEKKKKELQAEAESKLQREERQYMKMQEKKQKAFDREKKMREKKIYGTTHKAPSQFAALRKQLILSKLSNDPNFYQNQNEPTDDRSNKSSKPQKVSEKSSDQKKDSEKKEKKHKINSLAPKSLQTQIPKPSKSNSVSKSANEKSGSNSSHPIIQLPEVGKYKSKIPYLHVH